MKVVSFIPIKLNNQRLPGKNLMKLNGRPLCDYIFNTVKNISQIDEKYVYCSDEKICEYIPKEIKFLKRSADLDGFQVKGLDIIERFVEDIDADVYVLTHVTQPFTQAESIIKGLSAVLSGEFDSAFSCLKIQDYCWYKGKPFNYDMKDIVTTQNLEPIYMETGAFYIFTKDVFKRLHQRIGERPYMCVIDQLEAVDIDEAEDFNFAKVVAEFLERNLCYEDDRNS